METEISVSFLRDIVHFAASRGVTSKQLGIAAGVDPSLFGKLDERVKGSLSLKIWIAAEELTRDVDIGLHIGELAQPTSLGLVGFVMASCSSLGEAFEKLLAYTNLLTDGVRGTLTTDGRLARIFLAITEDRINFLSESPRQPVESTFAALVTIARSLTGKELPIRDVWFKHPRPASVVEHHRIFGPRIAFGEMENRLVFAEESLRYPIPLADHSILSSLEDQANQKLRGMEAETTLSELVSRQITISLKGDIPKIDNIARKLGKGSRTLQRELSEQGTSFQTLLDGVRHAMALKLLENKNYSIAEIAFLLGFSEPSAFHRSFKRWTGKTPREFRSSAF